MLIGLALITLIAYTAMFLVYVQGVRAIKRLSDLPVSSSREILPTVSLIIPARNEAQTLRPALASLLKQDYPSFEVIAVNDRSTDETGAILDEEARAHPYLNVVHLQELPAGWIGKNYALWAGARRATGTLYLFADADVIMEPVAIRRAVDYLTSTGLDHLTIFPEVVAPRLGVQMFVSAFCFFFALAFRPWKARDPRSSCYVGIGAFNLIRAQAYQAMGTHQAIAMRPDDDMKFGKLVKRAGLRQEVLYGRGLIRVTWYASLPEVIQGLMKNAFVGAGYSVTMVGLGVLLLALTGAWPFLALLVTRGMVQYVNGLIVAVIVLAHASHASLHRFKPWIGIGHPLASLIMSYVLIRATVTTLRAGGITWRGTYYPLPALRASRV